MFSYHCDACDLKQALNSGDLVEGGVVIEGSAGSTAISLAMVAPAFGCKCHVVIPDDAAIEKVIQLKYLYIFSKSENFALCRNTSFLCTRE